jgi:hypothetical protein
MSIDVKMIEGVPNPYRLIILTKQPGRRLDDVREAMRETNERFCLEVVGEAARFQRIFCIQVNRNERGTLASDYSQSLPFPL